MPLRSCMRWAGYNRFRRKGPDRITGFVCSHCSLSRSRMEDMMMETGMLTKDLGTILVGAQAVEAGLINEVGGIKEAIARLHEMGRARERDG